MRVNIWLKNLNSKLKSLSAAAAIKNSSWKISSKNGTAWQTGSPIFYDSVQHFSEFDFETAFFFGSGNALFFLKSRLLQMKYAGIRNASASIHAAGEAKQAAVKPYSVTIWATNHLPTISKSPATVAVGENPIPCMKNLTIFTRASGK